MISLENKYDKIIFDANSFIVLSKDLGQSKSIINTTKAVEQNGVYLNNSFLDSRDISIKGAILGRGNSISNLKNNLIKIINPLEPLTFIINDKKIECIASSTVKFDEKTAKFDYIEFFIELFCPDPFFMDLETKIVDMSSWTNNFSFELEIPNDGIEFGMKTSESIINLVNSSSIKTGLVIKILAKADCLNPRIINILTQEYIKINTTITAGDIITINTNFGNKRVELTKNGLTQNIINKLDINSVFLQLASGDNLLKLEAENGISNLSCQIFYTNKYLGV